jgi:hypothetical protein
MSILVGIRYISVVDLYLLHTCTDLDLDPLFSLFRKISEAQNVAFCK